MKIGLTLPNFTADASLITRVARRAEAEGLDGVFSFDHLWPIGAPHRPALSMLPTLGTVAAITHRVVLGPLVIRVGLLRDRQVVDGMLTLGAIAGGAERIVAAVGASDAASAPENRAYGLEIAPNRERHSRAIALLDALGAEGVETWYGGRSATARAVAAAHASALNMWSPDVGDVTAEVADLRVQASTQGRSVAVTWGGQVLIGDDRDDLAARQQRFGLRPQLVSGTIEAVADALAALDTAAGGAGLAWAVCGPLDLYDDPDAAVSHLGEVRRLLQMRSTTTAGLD